MIASSSSSTDSRRISRLNRGLFISGISLLCVGALTLGLTTLSYGQDSSKKPNKQKDNPPGKTTDAPEVTTVLVFPTDSKPGVSEAISDDVVDVIKSRLSATKLYAPGSFSPAIPTVRLALSQQTLTQSDVKKPFDNDAKLKKLTGVTGNTLVLVSAIDDYEFDSAKNQVSIVLSIRLVDYSGAKAVVRSGAQSATSPENKGNISETKVATALVRSLTDKVMTSILTPKPTQPAPKGVDAGAPK